MKQRILTTLAAAALAGLAGPASAFCGFYVARADSALYNDASKVVIARQDERTVVTMANDYSGDPREFAMVIPVPEILEPGQVHVAEAALVDHLDAYSAPRLVEYFDKDPCQVMYRLESNMMMDMAAAPKAAQPRSARSLGVTIEASYTVGEYDILILSATQSDGLITWLRQEAYRLPDGAEAVVGSYLRQGMKFFVARVNLGEQARLGLARLRPLQVAYTSPKFMLPIRLGTLNARGAQELYVYTLTSRGRVETTNYRTVKIPSGMDLPVAVKEDFAGFYRSMFSHQVNKQNRRAVFLEYAWDMAWCDPCAADPLSPAQLRELGVHWLGEQSSGPAQNVFVTRLHLRYDAEHFPDDLRFQETGDRSNFQGRYIIRHPWTGEARCERAERYLAEELPRRQRAEAGQLASLTGEAPVLPAEIDSAGSATWWQRLWQD